MKKFRSVLVLFVLACVPRFAESQTVSGRSFISGFELGSLAEGSAMGGSVDAGTGRSGSYAYHASPVNSNQYIGFFSRSSGGVFRSIFKSSRFYLRVNMLPQAGSVAIVRLGGAATFNPEIDLNSDGSFTLADSWYPSIAKSSYKLTDHLWHRIEFDVGSGLKAYVDGSLVAAGGPTSYPAAPAILFGAAASPITSGATADLYFDDVLVDGDSFSNTGLPGDGHAVLLRPTAPDPASLNSWTNGDGSVSNLWMPVSNVPAAGMPAPKATNLTQIKNGSHGNNLDYKPTVQTYTSAGVAGTVNAVMALTSDGQESSKGSAKTGSIWIDSNPSQGSGYSFDFGNASGVVGGFPSGWASHYGPVTPNPHVDLGSSPVVAVRKASGTNVDVDLIGVYVDYQ